MHPNPSRLASLTQRGKWGRSVSGVHYIIWYSGTSPLSSSHKDRLIYMTIRHLVAFVLLASVSMQAQIPPPRQTLLVTQSALNDAVALPNTVIARCRETAVYVEWSAGTTAGAVKVESASDAAFAGSWAPLATVTWSAASKEDIVQITGVHLHLRTRISTAIVGGTVSTWAVCI